jgi:DNA invertase Pin-like site-specific DNA recombinase
MSELNYFKKLKRKKEKESLIKKDVWLYTRVSTKLQFEKNGSIETQLEGSKEFASKNEMQIIQTFGGSYESAKGDFTRKEFKNLIDQVRKKRTKPYGILIYKINRFSRSGGSAIALVNELVERYGVHLIETFSGKSTETERGKVEVYENLLKARKDYLRLPSY